MWFGTRVEIEYLDAARLDGLARAAAVLDAPEARADRAPPPGPATGGASSCSTPTSSRGSRSTPSSRGCSAGDLFMHKQEYVLSESRRTRQPQAVGVAAAACRRRSRRGRRPRRRRMWNSGVLALPAADRGLLDRGARAVRRARRRRRAPLRHRAARRGGRPRPHRPPEAGGASGSPTTGATSPATTPRSPAAWPTRSSKGMSVKEAARVPRAADRSARGSASDPRRKSSRLDPKATRLAGLAAAHEAHGHECCDSVGPC